MPETNGKRTERLAFRLEPERAKKVRALADMEGVSYSALLREKVDELVAKHDRIMAKADEQKTAA